MKLSEKILFLFKMSASNSNKMESLSKFLNQKIERISSREGLPIGEHTYIVGGAVRNFILDKDIKDIDIVIDSVSLGGFDSAKLAEELQREISVYTTVETNNYGVAILSIKGPLLIDGYDFSGEQIEIANARSESYSGGGYKPEKVSPATIEEDVFRREFTFNTLMWRIADIATGFDKAEIIDITGCGIDDLNSGEMRCPKDPDIVFSDDPSRMLRAIKFISKYGFKLPDNIKESIIKNSDKIKNIPPNQIGSILINQILIESSYRSSLILMSSLKLLDPIRDMLAAPQTKDESALKSFILSHSKEREVGFLLSLLEVNLPLSEPLKFLTEEQRERLGQITSSMSAEDGWNFIGMLSNPGDAVKDREFFGTLLTQFVKNKKDTPIFVNTIYKPTVINILLSNPEIINDKDLLKQRIIEEINIKINS
jgi:tRNA nucleotidyltransferase/poly(A) polymerase